MLHPSQVIGLFIYLFWGRNVAQLSLSFIVFVIEIHVLVDTDSDILIFWVMWSWFKVVSRFTWWNIGKPGILGLYLFIWKFLIFLIVDEIFKKESERRNKLQ